MAITSSIPLSIIMPVYNKAEYVEKCLQSILEQDYTHYELIIVNDGSTDGSADIIRRLADQRIKLISTPNQGVSSARNGGMAEAHGDFLLFVDADDYLSPHYLSHIMQMSLAQKADLYVWGITKDYADGRQRPIVPQSRGLLDAPTFLHEMALEQYQRHEGIMGYIPNKLLKRDIISRHHIQFNPTIKLQEDYDFFLSYYAHVHSALFFHESGYHYVEHPPVAGAAARQVDYLSLIDIHRRSLLLTSQSTSPDSDRQLVLKAIGKLTLAMFLEMQPVTISLVRRSLSSIHQRPECIGGLQVIRPKQERLRQFLCSRSTLCTYTYLKCRSIYYSIRKKGFPT